MRKLLLISTALIGFVVASPASAAPIGAIIAGALGFTAGSVGFAIVSGVVSMAISVGLSSIAQKLTLKKPKREAVRAELMRPTSLPPYRFVYGKTWAPGTPVGWVVKGRILYICYLLNSRPSAGPFTVMIDKRTVTKTGDATDFSAGGGATANAAPFSGHLKYWIGYGTQTTCPAQIVSESGGHFISTDAWRGRTVLWARMDCGDDDERNDRWPTTPPELNVDGNWSIVRDPRDGQDKFSRNQALIVLDALRNNPVRPYPDGHLRIDTFEWGADVAGQSVGVVGGGTIPRYSCDGILTFDDGAEIEDQLEPLMAAGASRFARVGGKIAFIPAIARPSVKTITDFTDSQPIDLDRWKPADDLFTEAVARFPSPDRAYESAETPAFVVSGAQAADGGVAKRLQIDLDFVTDHRQAQRLAKINVLRSRMQRQVSAELFPDAFDLVAGSVCTLNLPAPFTPWNTKYEVASIAPAAGVGDGDSITIRLPTVITEENDSIYAWTAATDEQEMLTGSFGGARPRIQPPAKPTMTTGTAAARESGDAVVPAVIAAWTASASPSAMGYEWEWTRSLAGASISGWNAGGALAASAADDSGVFSANIPWVEIGKSYWVRVRATGAYGASAWRVSDAVTAAGPVVSVFVPPRPTATAASSTRINISAQQANDGRARQLLVYSNSVDNSLTATLLATLDAGASVTVSASQTGLSSGTTRYYWSRARDQWGNLSAFSTSDSATTP